jgi:hypothetical protein
MFCLNYLVLFFILPFLSEGKFGLSYYQHCADDMTKIIYFTKIILASC